jgi:hypothetical protein
LLLCELFECQVCSEAEKQTPLHVIWKQFGCWLELQQLLVEEVQVFRVLLQREVGLGCWQRRTTTGTIHWCVTTCFVEVQMQQSLFRVFWKRGTDQLYISYMATHLLHSPRAPCSCTTCLS